MGAVIQCLVLLSVIMAVTHGWLFSSSSSSGGGSSPRSFPHDVRSQTGLTSLYNQRVTHAERVRRPLGSSSWMAGPLSHSGVVVTTQDGNRWLVHKGNGYGRTSQTVVTNAGHMSDRWRSMGGHDVRNSRVSDYVRAGGAGYSLPTNNCHHGSCRMIGLDKKK